MVQRMADGVYHRLLLAFLMTVVALQAVFAAFPGIDLVVSGLFAEGRAGFPWADGPAATANLILRRLAELAMLSLVLWCLYGGLAGHLRGDGLRAWLFAAAVPVLASGGVVNLVLKAHVGRARPDQLAAFGGEATFSPAWQVTDQCTRNCSFTSGEVALSASLGIVGLVLIWPRLTRVGQRLAAVTGVAGFVAVVALLRVGLGRHFLSDAVFSVLISTGVALALYPLLGISRARIAFDPALPLAVVQSEVEGWRVLLRAWLKRPT